jgi:hypothetical protein
MHGVSGTAQLGGEGDEAGGQPLGVVEEYYLGHAYIPTSRSCRTDALEYWNDPPMSSNIPDYESTNTVEVSRAAQPRGGRRPARIGKGDHVIGRLVNRGQHPIKIRITADHRRQDRGKRGRLP